MYILKVHNSEKDHSIVVPFSDRENVINDLKDQYQTILSRLQAEKEDYIHIKENWNDDYKSMEECLDAFLSHETTSLYVSIQYQLSPELNQELHSEKIPRDEVISWEIFSKLQTCDKEVIKLMIDPRYEFECNISEEMLYGANLMGAAFVRFNDIGVAYRLYVNGDEDRSAIYKMVDGEISHAYWTHYEINPKDSQWKENLEIAMCKAFIQLHYFEVPIDELFQEMIGMRFSSIQEMEYWIAYWISDKLDNEEISFPGFTLSPCPINEEVIVGKAEVDYAIDGTFGEDMFGLENADFTIEYLKDNSGLMYITSVRWD